MGRAVTRVEGGLPFRPHQTFAQSVGVDEAAGAAQLTEQGSHLEVAKSAVKLTA